MVLINFDNSYKSVLQLPSRSSFFLIDIENLSITYLIADPPSVDDVVIESTKTGPLVDNQDTVKLSCGADSNPPPEITWLKAPKNETELELILTGEDLNLSPVTKEDAGTYYCIVSNDFGYVNKTFDIEVLCK